MHHAVARRGPAPRPAAAARRHSRTADGREVRHAGAGQYRRARPPGQGASRPASCSPRCSGTKCWRTGKSSRPVASRRFRRFSRRWTTVLDVQGEKLAITRRIAGDIKDIWLLQPRFEAARRQAPLRPARTAALPRRLRLPAAARRIRRSRAGTGRLVDRFPGRRRRRARAHAAAGTGRRQEAPPARAKSRLPAQDAPAGGGAAE